MLVNLTSGVAHKGMFSNHFTIFDNQMEGGIYAKCKFFYLTTATASTSQSTPLGSSLTATVDLAGLGSAVK